MRDDFRKEGIAWQDAAKGVLIMAVYVGMIVLMNVIVEGL